MRLGYSCTSTWQDSNFIVCLQYKKLQIVNPTGVLMGRTGVISVDSTCYHAQLETVHPIQILSK